MNKKILKTLEFDKILQLLTTYAISSIGKEVASQLTPYTDINIINEKLEETADATNLIIRQGSLPLGGIKNIQKCLKRLEIGGNLSIHELLDISELLRVTKKVISYANQCGEFLDTTSIKDMFQLLDSVHVLYTEITRCILSEEEIADDASAKLQTLRRDIQSTHSKIRQHLNKILTSSNYKIMLQDSLITVKNDRFCVPIKAEYRSSFPGMIHEQSSSGSTLFIEPLSVVELNNTLKTLIDDEGKEIERILAELSGRAAEHIYVLESNQTILSKLDFIFAKGELALNMRCSKPIFNTDKKINLKKACHPLLDPKTVVPTDLYIGDNFNTLVITGPNTGGKTVTLKTVGLLSLMGQAGLYIPAFDNSSLTVFEEIFADIGDEQSIAQSLSTFSSHMTNIIEILSSANENSLVLFDELGAGTDPTEGAALAMAILENLYSRQVITIATTHYSELKVYALSTKGVENASQEFDVQTLRPTYKLLIGVPGKSNAFAISKRLGLSDDIIDEAKNLLEGKEIRFEDLITDLEMNKKQALYEKEKAERFRVEAEKLQKEVQIQKDKVSSQKERILTEAKEEAYAILYAAKQDADNIIKDMNQLVKNSKTLTSGDLEKNRSQLRNALTDLESKIVSPSRKQKATSPTSVKKGDTVHVYSLDQSGTVISAPNNKGEVQVQLGIMQTKVNISDITLKQDNSGEVSNKRSPRTSGKKMDLNKSLSMSSELDVRGTTSDEALTLVEKYLDDAYLSHLPQVTIIHGKGTGALRMAIHSQLKKIKYVKAFRLGVYGEGETGVTIVELK
ncbi:MAG: endonuclease MutS2 [Firmicutes bacterium HGW-Firmicutes-1]|jgi:DNA mismatch repair protein MutS2|nr:MAG: endonuclease MutS2 [Firmicutes bacterium HGW-Firmicutes-1]